MKAPGHLTLIATIAAALLACGLTAPQLLEQLPLLEDEISAADAVIVGIAHNSIPLSNDSPCGSSFDAQTNTLEDWSKVDERCAAAADEPSQAGNDLITSILVNAGFMPLV